jgi:hypothetical protein
VHNANVELLLQAVHWDVVVLQERSWRLSQDERTWRAGTWPYARTLNAEIRALGSRTAIYETWGYRSGQFAGDSFGAMQERPGRGSLPARHRALDLARPPDREPVLGLAASLSGRRAGFRHTWSMQRVLERGSCGRWTVQHRPKEHPHGIR